MKRGMVSIIVAAALALGTLTVPAFGAGGGPAHKDKQFMMKAAKDGLAEVQLGQLAQQQASAQEVKDFGSRMVTDHSKANDELTALAQQKNVKLPTKVDRSHTRMMDKLKKQTGAAFDKAYMTEMVREHTKDVTEFQKAQGKVKDADVKAFIDKTLPVLQQHLQSAKEIAGKVAGGQ